MNFDLRTLVDQVLADTDLTEPGDIAAEVAERTPRHELRGAYVVALAGYVRVINNASRHNNPILKPNSGQSAKVTAIRDWWRAALHDRVYVDKTWKTLGNCTYGDLMLVAKQRRELANANMVTADRYEALAQLLLTNGVDTVADLRNGDTT